MLVSEFMTKDSREGSSLPYLIHLPSILSHTIETH